MIFFLELIEPENEEEININISHKQTVEKISTSVECHKNAHSQQVVELCIRNQIAKRGKYYVIKIYDVKWYEEK